MSGAKKPQVRQRFIGTATASVGFGMSGVPEMNDGIVGVAHLFSSGGEVDRITITLRDDADDDARAAYIGLDTEEALRLCELIRMAVWSHLEVGSDLPDVARTSSRSSPQTLGSV